MLSQHQCSWIQESWQDSTRDGDYTSDRILKLTKGSEILDLFLACASRLKGIMNSKHRDNRLVAYADEEGSFKLSV